MNAASSSEANTVMRRRGLFNPTHQEDVPHFCLGELARVVSVDDKEGLVHRYFHHPIGCHVRLEGAFEDLHSADTDKNNPPGYASSDSSHMIPWEHTVML